MKKCVFLTFMIVFVSTMAGPIYGQEKTETYVNDTIGFSIEYPATWKNAKVKGGNIVVLFLGGTFNRNVQVMYDKGGEEGGMAALEKLAGILRNQKEMVAEWKQINGQRSYYQVVEWQSPLGDSRAIRLMVPSGDNYFLVMGVCPASEFDALSPLLNKCVLSFQIAR